MSDVRKVDLNGPPDANVEVRLQLGRCIVSVWLPAPAGELGAAMTALAEAGFDVARNGEEP